MGVSARARTGDETGGPEAQALLRWVGWAGLAGVWLFLAAAMVSFDPADPPSFAVWPHNDPVRNWCGPVGAWIAYQGFRLLGTGAWLLLGAFGLLLGVLAAGRRVHWLPLRSIGIAMVATTVAGVQALLFGGLSSLPDLAGGLLGQAAAVELEARFSVLGSLLWLLALGAIGAIVAFDRWLVVIPAWVVGRMRPAAARAGVGAGRAARASGGLVSGLARLAGQRQPVRVRLNDLEEDEELEEAVGSAVEAKPRKPKRRVTPVAKPEPDEVEEEAWEEPEDEYEDADEEDEWEYEYEDEDAGEEDDEPEEAGEDEEQGVPGAPQIFSEDQLREKIAKLPLRFAASTKSVATDEDLRDLQGVVDLPGYRFPGLDLLEGPEEDFSETLESMVREQAEALEAALHEYRIKGEVVGIESGPVITLYHVRLAPGTKVAQLTNVSSDIARSLMAVNIRIVPNMVGRDTVGVEVPNRTKEKVRMKELMSDPATWQDMRLPMFLGKDASGDPLIADLAKAPHMLIAGTTGSGKSVCMNTIIMGFLYTKKPNELKLVLVDPKMVEMSQFKDIPHLMCPVVTEMSRAAAILEWAVQKMDERYALLAEAGCRDIAAYNSLTWEELKERFEPATEEEAARIPRKLPYMVFIIDELADLMMTHKEVEGSIIRIAQKARAVGIHLILATQRPQANVVTGLIKSNMPCRIAFKVASGMDSRIVLDQKGGELLLGQGDMLFLSPHSHKLLRSQGTLVDDQEIRRVVRFMRDVARPTFERQLVQLRKLDDDEERLVESENNSSASLAAAQEDPLFDRAVEIVLETKRGSVSLLQRRLAIGYTRASRLIDLMGIAGIIGEHKGSVAREVMITPEEWEAMQEFHERELARLRGEGQEGLFDGVRAARPADSEADTPAGGESGGGAAVATAPSTGERDQVASAAAPEPAGETEGPVTTEVDRDVTEEAPPWEEEQQEDGSELEAEGAAGGEEEGAEVEYAADGEGEGEDEWEYEADEEEDEDPEASDEWEEEYEEEGDEEEDPEAADEWEEGEEEDEDPEVEDEAYEEGEEGEEDEWEEVGEADSEDDWEEEAEEEADEPVRG